MNKRTDASGSIPCSIGILTFNSEVGLPACLESVKQFAEIVICDGNSTDRTLDIARSYGAILTKQYDTDEPNVRCETDKAYVRQRNMDAATYDWYFVMDSDDTLSPEVVEEIRTIVTSKNPPHHVYRMQCRIYIDGTEIKHAAVYPSYQTRLVHRSLVRPHFKGLVHDRLAFASTYSVGELSSFYNFHWSAQRVKEYWRYIGGYAKREIATIEFGSFSSALYWLLYKRLRTILGYIFWRLPKLYLLHRDADTIPLRIELLTIRYHVYILFGSLWGYVRSRVWYVLLSETIRGKDLNRTLTNLACRSFEAYGRILDVGGGDGAASYWRFMKRTRWHAITTVDIEPRNKPDVLLNLEESDLPFPTEHFDTVMLFNILEHINKRQAVLMRIRQVLRKDGMLVGSIPFLVNVHPDPNDYVRLTRQGLQELFADAGFSSVEIQCVGYGPLTASYYQSEFLMPRILKLISTPLVLALDRIVITLRPEMKEKFPLSYTFRARK